MTGYLVVTDERTLTPAGKDVVSKEFLPRDEYTPGSGSSGAPFPTYSGTAPKEKTWIAPFYNQESKTLSTFRGMIADATYSGVDRHIVCIGDSKTNGSGPNVGKAYMDGYPSVLRRMLGAVDGVITAEPGGAQWDDRWTSSGMRAPYVLTEIGVVPINGNPGPFQIGFAPGFNHTGGTFWVNAQPGAVLTVTVDGGTPEDLTVPAGNGFHAVTPTVTGDSAHTYEITSATGFHLTVFEPTYATPQLKVTRMGRGGSSADDWAPGKQADGTGNWDTLLLANADAILIGHGTNGTQGAINVAALEVLYASAIALGVHVMAIAPGGLGGTGGLQPIANYIPMYEKLWSLADLHDIPLVDFQHIIGDWPTATENGLIADVVHETRAGYAYEAGALRTLLT